MSVHNYSRALDGGHWDTDIKLLAKEIETALPGKSFVARANGLNIVLDFNDALTGPETTTLDGTVSSHQAAGQALERAKSLKITSIDLRTRELIDEGFEFPPTSGDLYSLSTKGQLTLLGLDAARADLTYPVEYNKKDDKGKGIIPDNVTAHNFFLSAVATARAHLDSGTALKDQVRAASTVAAVDAVVDSR